MATAFGRATRARQETGAWHGTAFMVEALVLLAFLIGAIALFVQLFAVSRSHADEAAQLSDAVLLAQQAAEEFAANPAAALSATAPSASQLADANVLEVRINTEEAETAAGSLVSARIVVVDSQGEEVYALDTARYVAQAEGAAA